jgi:lipoyl synthase
VAKFYTPEEFAALGEQARARGFLSVASGPFVRSSYNAGEVFSETRTVRARIAAGAGA